jgi:TatD DNase family protein
MLEFIDIHTHRMETVENTFSIWNSSLPSHIIVEKRYFSAGWHPWQIEAFDLILIEKALKEIASIANVIALGECGFDRSIKTQIEKQAEVFRFHLNLANEHHKPLIIHCVRAYSDLVEILKKEKFRGRFVLHNFNGNQFQIDSILEFNAYFSFGKQLMAPNQKLIKSLKNIPIERIFFETDNSKFSISEIYLQASSLLQIPIEKLKIQIKNNFTHLFGFDLPEKTLEEL